MNDTPISIAESCKPAKLMKSISRLITLMTRLTNLSTNKIWLCMESLKSTSKKSDTLLKKRRTRSSKATLNFMEYFNCEKLLGSTLVTLMVKCITCTSNYRSHLMPLVTSSWMRANALFQSNSLIIFTLGVKIIKSTYSVLLKKKSTITVSNRNKNA